MKNKKKLTHEKLNELKALGCKIINITKKEKLNDENNDIITLFTQTKELLEGIAEVLGEEKPTHHDIMKIVYKIKDNN